MMARHTFEAYGRRAREYADLLGSISATAAQDRALIETWARATDGPVLDVGCGPGHWTAWLHELGVDVEGIDPVQEFVDIAAHRHPDCVYRQGTAEALGVPSASLGGALVWYSLIHTEPSGLPVALAELASCIRPGGGLLLGFFEGSVVEPFGHTVATAFTWPIADLARLLDDAGFIVEQAHARTDAGARPHGAIVATRAAGA
ncbi:class I SAM-dependent methyltransferase [Pseudoclavibacter sp. RFBB5]|uniref:class I SAM-dependent methyltransferase n=1 Tax=Pseudoclavibacter sp. RFBB5 TaxID=2080574 RepID=UPI000CE89FD4|nr:class I SAM-dependent methyltransferase [Pseudoclavibacter sp. RFBB5]PPG31279.1 SAM-dependent methyltransferase [Pseudoclavibacter sp. RFBB5]